MRSLIIAVAICLGFVNAEALVYSTFLGGSGGETGYALCSDGNGGIVVTGLVDSDDFPTTQGAFSRDMSGEHDLFITHFSADGSRLLFSTYLGGSARDYDPAITRHPDNGYVLFGSTLSDDFPTTNGAYRRERNEGEYTRDAYIARINEQGNRLVYGTFFGSLEDADKNERAVVVLENGNIIVAGYTWGTDMPTTEGAFAEDHRGGGDRIDAYVACFEPDGSELIYCTYLGGSGQESPDRLISRDNGNVVLAGFTSSADFPVTEGAFQPNGFESFITCLNADGSDLVFSTYLGGGENNDNIVGFCQNGDRELFAAGLTSAHNFPVTEGAFDPEFNGGESDVFVVKFTDDAREKLFATYLGGNSAELGYADCSDGAGGVVVAGVTMSENFPVTDGSHDSEFNGEIDVFVSRLSSDGSELIYSTFIGGADEERAVDIIILKENIIAFTGYAKADDYPVTDNAYDREFNGGGVDAILTKVDVSRVLFVEVQWVDIPPDTLEYFETDRVVFNLRGTGPQGRELRIIYEPNGLPDEAHFVDLGDGSGTFDWQTDYEDAGTYSPLFRITDGRTSEDLVVTLIIHNVNREPVFVHIDDSLWVNENEPLVCMVSASDPDGDSLRLMASSETLPQGWRFEDRHDGTGEFFWIPTYSDSGSYDVLFTVDDGQSGADTTAWIIVHDVLEVDSDFILHPSSFILSNPFPNPFNSTTTIRFGLPVAGEVSLIVRDLSGRKVAELLARWNSVLQAGYHEVVWNAGDFPAGVYLVELVSGEQKLLQKVVLTR